jgi:hypothetical protein
MDRNFIEDYIIIIEAMKRLVYEVMMKDWNVEDESLIRRCFGENKSFFKCERMKRLS